MITTSKHESEIATLIDEAIAAQSALELVINRLEDLDPRRALAMRVSMLETAAFMLTLGDRSGSGRPRA